MIVVSRQHGRIAFGLFEADLETGELWRSGRKIKLQSLPFRVMKVLLQSPGEIITREELQRIIWGSDVNVDFEQALGSAIKKIREALGDVADNPRFIETLSKRGYRFIAPTSVLAFNEEPVSALVPQSNERAEVIAATPIGERAAETSAVLSFRMATIFWAILTVAVVSAAGSIVVFQWRTSSSYQSPLRMTQVTSTGQFFHQGARSFETLPATVANGEHLFTSAVKGGRLVLSQVSVATGDVQDVSLPSDVGEPEVNAVSDDGSSLLLRSQSPVGLEQSEQPLWIVPINGGSASRVSNVVGHAATWVPSSDAILYATGNNLLEIPSEGASPQPFATLPGRAFWLRWSPDEKRLRFTVLDLKARTSSLWEIAAGQHLAHPLLPKWSKPASECCGIWTADGKYFVFQSTHDGHTDLWRMKGTSSSSPVRITNGPLSYESPVPARKGSQIFFTGRDPHIEWQLRRFDAKRNMLVPLQGLLAHAGRVIYSRDQQWVAWTDISGRLWKSRVDGLEKLELTSGGMEVLNASWAPNGSRLAIMARVPGEPWAVYSIDPSGGSPERLSESELKSVGDPSFSPDGTSILFGGLPFLMGANDRHPLEVVDVATKSVRSVSQSDQLYSPRWSPDGRYIVALTFDQKKLMLYDVAHQTWKALATMAISDPIWTSDSKAVYFQAYKADNQPIYRVSLSDGRLEVVGDISCGAEATRCFLSGLEPDNTPLVLVETCKGDLYTMDLDGQR